MLAKWWDNLNRSVRRLVSLGYRFNHRFRWFVTGPMLRRFNKVNRIENVISRLLNQLDQSVSPDF